MIQKKILTAVIDIHVDRGWCPWIKISADDVGLAGFFGTVVEFELRPLVDRPEGLLAGRVVRVERVAAYSEHQTKPFAS